MEVIKGPDLAGQYWCPTADVFMGRVRIPTRSRAKLVGALPFALEESLLQDAAQLHFSFKVLGENELAFAVIRRDLLRRWLGQLGEKGIQPRVLCPSALALPSRPGRWSVGFGGGESCWRCGPFEGFAWRGQEEGPPFLLAKMLSSAADRPQGLDVFEAPDSFDPARWSVRLGLAVDLRSEPVWSGANPAPLNLLQGEFAPPAELSSALAGLRPAALLLAAWSTLAFCMGAFEWGRSARRLRACRREMLAEFRKAFGQTRAVVDPALQMERGWQELRRKSPGAAHGLLPLLARSTAALGSGRVNSIEYADGSLLIVSTFPDFQSMEAASRALSERGLRSEVLAADGRGGVVEGRLRIRPIEP